MNKLDEIRSEISDWEHDLSMTTDKKEIRNLHGELEYLKNEETRLQEKLESE